MLHQYTYSQLKKEEFRKDIQEAGIASVGTQSGNFGKFTEHFRTVSASGAETLRRELELTADLIGVTYDQFMESMPELERLLS